MKWSQIFLNSRGLARSHFGRSWEVGDVISAIFGKHNAPQWIKKNSDSNGWNLALGTSGYFCLTWVCTAVGQLGGSASRAWLAVSWDDRGDGHVSLVLQKASLDFVTWQLGKE